MNTVSFVIGAVLFVGGIVLFGYSWDGTVFHWMIFVAGLVAISASIAIPVHLLKRIDA